MNLDVDVPCLVHEIVCLAIPFLALPAEIRERANNRLLTPSDCRLIADELGRIGRLLTSSPDLEEALHLGEESVRLIRAARDENEIRARQPATHTSPRSSHCQPCLEVLLTMAPFRRVST